MLMLELRIFIFRFLLLFITWSFRYWYWWRRKSSCRKMLDCFSDLPQSKETVKTDAKIIIVASKFKQQKEIIQAQLFQCRIFVLVPQDGDPFIQILRNWKNRQLGNASQYCSPDDCILCCKLSHSLCHSKPYLYTIHV